MLGAIDFINKLAPLSIVITALGILNTIRLARVKRRQDDAQALRETLNTAGTTANTLNWSLLGRSDVTIPLLALRDMIETRLTKPVTAQALSGLLNDQLLIEPMIAKAWRDSGEFDRFRQQFLDFGRLEAEIGSRIPLVYEALERINAQLRVLLHTDSNLIVTVRNDSRYRNIASLAGKPVDPLSHVHRMFAKDARHSSPESFSHASQFLNALAGATASASDKRILMLFRPLGLLDRWKHYLARRNAERRDRILRPQLARQLEENFPNEAPMLTVALDTVLSKTRELRQNDLILRDSAEKITNTLRTSQDSDLAKATKKLVETLSSSYRDDIYTMHALIRLKTLGIPDPEIDAALGLEIGSLELVKSADARGANLMQGPKTILNQHVQHLTSFPDVFLN